MKQLWTSWVRGAGLTLELAVYFAFIGLVTFTAWTVLCHFLLWIGFAMLADPVHPDELDWDQMVALWRLGGALWVPVALYHVVPLISDKRAEWKRDDDLQAQTVAEKKTGLSTHAHETIAP